MFRWPWASAASLCWIIAASAGSAATVSDGSAALYLEALVNDTPTGLVIEVRQSPDGAIRVAPSELASIGIAVGSGEPDADGRVDLGRLPGVHYSYDAAAQVISIVVPATGLAPHHYSARKTGSIAQPDGRPLAAAVLNYSLYGTIGSDGAPGISGLFDGWWSTTAGVLDQSAILRAGGSQGSAAVRLNTTWTAYNPDSLVTWSGGDIISGGLGWTRPLRLGGVQARTDFTLRPDMVTAPLPRFAGTAALPSTVDVYAKGVTLFSGEVAPGPFTIADLPVVSGAGTARVVVADALGRTTETNLPFFFSPRLLGKGLGAFSVEAGFPRRAFGVENADYAPLPVLSATLRRGVSDDLTLEAHGETTAGVVNAGLGMLKSLAGHALIDGSLAASGGSGGLGIQAGIGVEWQLPFGTFRLRSTRTFGGYADVAAVTALPGFDGSPPRAVDQVSLAVPLTFFRSSLVAAFTRTELAASTVEIATLGYSQRIGATGNLYVSGYCSPSGGSAGLFVGFSRNLGPDIVANASLSSRSGPYGGVIDLARSGGAAPGSMGWNLAASVGSQTNWRAAARFSSDHAFYSTGIRGTGSAIAASGEVDGALVAADDALFSVRRVDDAFAIVDAGGPNVTVYSDNHPVGRTNAEGKLLVTGLRAWEHNRIAIDVNEMPLSETAERTAAVVAPTRRGAVALNFGVRTTDDAATVIVRKADGRFPEPGTPGSLAGGNEFVVGYDGEAYIQGLKPTNAIALDLGGGSTCSASFRFEPSAAAPTVIDGVVCR